MSIVGQQNIIINQSYQYAVSFSSSYLWRVEGGVFIGANDEIICIIIPTSENCKIFCTIGTGETLTFVPNVCIPITQGTINSSVPFVVGNEIQFTFEGNGNNLLYHWEIEGGYIVSSNNQKDVKVVFTQELGKIKITVNNCAEYKLERIITNCIAVQVEIDGETEIEDVDELYYYTTSSISGTLPFIYTWIVVGGDVIYGQSTNTIQVKWRHAEQHSVMLNIQNCGGWQQKTLEVNMGIIKSASLKLGTECLEKCTDVHGLSLPRSVIKMYNQNNTLIYITTADGRGVYKFCNICNEKSVYVTQTVVGKAESDRSNIISQCKECEVEPKLYISQILCKPKCEDVCN